VAKLGRDVFIALAAIGWADGKLDAEEADAIVRAALEEGLDLAAIAEIEAATKKPVTLDFLDRSAMGKDDRLFVYAMAAWIARIDGEVTPDEVAALEQLGRMLGVPERPRAAAEALVRHIAEADGDRPLRYDLARLRKTIEEKLIEEQHRRSL
jgi:uncharacterized membrane protein YebE (DUF533 family)